MKRLIVFIISLILIECHPEHLNKNGDNLGSFRRKRNLGDVVPGIDAQKFTKLSGSGSYANGKSCLTGREPFDKKEVDLVRKFYSLEVKYTEEEKKKKKDSFSYSVLSERNVHKHLSERVNKLHGPNCASKICSVDLVKMGLLCGKLPGRKFEHGKSCLDGTDVIEADDYKKISSEADLKRVNPAFPAESRRLEMNETMKMYGRNCQSGNCTYDAGRGSYVCSNAGKTTPGQLLLAIVITVGIAVGTAKEPDAL